MEIMKISDNMRKWIEAQIIKIYQTKLINEIDYNNMNSMFHSCMTNLLFKFSFEKDKVKWTAKHYVDEQGHPPPCTDNLFECKKQDRSY